MTEDDTPEALEARCWALRERAEQAESERDKALACVAEMRNVFNAMPFHDPYEPIMKDMIKHALSTDCGKGWLSPEKSRLLVEALERRQNCVVCGSTGMLCGGVACECRVNAAATLSAVKGQP